MNIVQGITTEGMELQTEDNWLSIEGLRFLVDGRDLVTTVDGKVTNWGDKSAASNNLVGKSLKPSYEKNALIKSVAANEYLLSPKKDYKFLSDGSKFAIYIIFMPIWSIALPSSGFGAIATANAAQVGLQGIIGSSQNMGRFGFILRGGATPQSKMIANLLNPAHVNYSPSGQMYAASFVNFGQDKGITIRYNSKVVELTPFFPTLAEYPQASNSQFIVCSGADGLTLNLAQLAIFNWGAFTLEEAIGFDERARALQAIDKEEIKKLLI